MGVALLVGVLVHEAQRTRLETVAVLGPDPAHALWRVERPRELTSLTLRTVGRVVIAPDKAYELWALPRGGKPVSLGAACQRHAATGAERHAERRAARR